MLVSLIQKSRPLWARQGEDLVDDVLARHQHLTRVLVQGGQALQLCPQPVLHLGLELRLHLRLDCFDTSLQIRFEVVDVQVHSKVAVSKARVALQGRLGALQVPLSLLALARVVEIHKRLGVPHTSSGP